MVWMKQNKWLVGSSIGLGILGLWLWKANSPESGRNRQLSSEKTIHVAVASNFTAAMQALVKKFEAQSDYQVKLSFGSTGKLYAQINHGAPFDAFFSADSLRPELLEKNKLAIAGSRFTYALGQLVLWSPDTELVDQEGRVLESSSFRYLSLANPELAPYGSAARSVLQAKGQWQNLQDRLVMGQNIAQTYQFIDSGNAQLGFVAYSQLKRQWKQNKAGTRSGHAKNSIEGSHWIVPTSHYPPIEQQAVVINDRQAVRAFVNYLGSEEARQLMAAFGYRVPPPQAP